MLSKADRGIPHDNNATKNNMPTLRHVLIYAKYCPFWNIDNDHRILANGEVHEMETISSNIGTNNMITKSMNYKVVKLHCPTTV